MSTPIGTQILDEIGDRLTNITETNGYFTTYGKIDRTRLKPFGVSDLPALNYWPGEDVLIETGFKWTKRLLAVFIEYHNMTRDEPFSDVINEMAADIIIALNRATGAPAVSDDHSHSLGGLISQIKVETISPAIGEGQTPWCAVAIEFSIEYKVAPNDPFAIIL